MRVLRLTEKVNAPPVQFFGTPPLSERPRSSARAGVKEPEPRNSCQNRCHSPTTLSKLLYIASVRLPIEGPR